MPGNYELKFGYNASVGSSFETCWTGSSLYTYMTGGTQLILSSSSTDDVATSGTGAWTVQVDTLTNLWVEQTETISLNGRTGVNFVADDNYRLHRMKVMTAGTGGTNAGIIYAGTGALTDGVPANSFGEIAAGYAQTLMGLFTIKASAIEAYIEEFTAGSATAKEIVVRLMVKEFGSVFQIKDLILFSDNHVLQETLRPIKVGAKADIEIQVKAGAGGGHLTTTFAIKTREL